MSKKWSQQIWRLAGFPSTLLLAWFPNSTQGLGAYLGMGSKTPTNPLQNFQSNKLTVLTFRHFLVETRFLNLKGNIASRQFWFYSLQIRWKPTKLTSSCDMMKDRKKWTKHIPTKWEFHSDESHGFDSSKTSLYQQNAWEMRVQNASGPGS